MQGSVLSASPLKRISALASKTLKALTWPAIIIGVVVAIDQFTKMWAVETLSLAPPMSVIGDFLMFTLVYNDGGALGTSFGPSRYYLISASLILLFVLYFLYQNRFHLATSIPLSFISAGAIGNIVDRLRIGKVVDFIDVNIPDVDIFGLHLERWWTFNIADAAISCSIVFLLAHVLIFQRSQQEGSTESASELPTGAEQSSSSPESGATDPTVRDDK